MKLIFAVTTLFTSALCFAQAPNVQITSFYYLGSNTKGAELCGKVLGASGTEIVQITVDPKSKSPVHYTSLLADDNSFCAVVLTMTGEAAAGVKGQPLVDFASIGSAHR